MMSTAIDGTAVNHPADRGVGPVVAGTPAETLCLRHRAGMLLVVVGALIGSAGLGRGGHRTDCAADGTAGRW